MTPQQVQDSWAQVMPISDQAAAMFYNRLFELRPDYLAMFKKDISEQSRMLMSMLNIAVTALEGL